MSRGTRTAPTAPVAPLLVGPDNAVAARGCSWREALALARSVGVPVVEVGERRLIPARQLAEALERGAAEPELDPEAAVLARLGRGRR
ncbi:MAG: hypothetical protein KJ058_19580 [Thermoanaerobaculia bacterium]|nr:hypothetical protein [Thermoanaerobaculia bacterium]